MNHSAHPYKLHEAYNASRKTKVNNYEPASEIEHHSLKKFLVPNKKQYTYYMNNQFISKL